LRRCVAKWAEGTPSEAKVSGGRRRRRRTRATRVEVGTELNHLTCRPLPIASITSIALHATSPATTSLIAEVLSSEVQTKKKRVGYSWHM
jgi:hypothetical protein